MKGKLFIIADAACTTGFATVTHNIIEHLHDKWDISVLGINYHGDPHPIQSKVKLYCPRAHHSGDLYGTFRTESLINMIQPDVVLFINDPWVTVKHYLEPLKNAEHQAKNVLYTPIDAAGLKPQFVEPLNHFDCIIAYTEFGRQELLKAGLTTRTEVIPHGVDTSQFFPMDKLDARLRFNFPKDWFVVQCVNRNQIRKRIDLLFYAFSKWVTTHKLPDTVKLHYHGALIDEGWDIMDLGRKYNLDESGRLIITDPRMRPGYGIPIEDMNYIYNIADLHVSTSMGEGWGLTTHESMACRIANVVPDHSAFSEWPKDSVEYIDLIEEPCLALQINTEQRQISVNSLIDKLDLLYHNTEHRKDLARKAYRLATKTEYQWKNIAKQFNSIFMDIF